MLTDATVTLPDAVRCDDHGALINELDLDLAIVNGDRCVWRFHPVPTNFNPLRLKIAINKQWLSPLEPTGGYALDGDVIRITGAPCERILSLEASQLAISARYGVCRNWE